MDRAEAHSVTKQRSDELRKLDYDDLLRRYSSDVGMEPDWEQVTASSGVTYDLQLYVFWDGPPPNLRVWVSADDGSKLGFMFPVTECFIIAPDGSFIGE